MAPCVERWRGCWKLCLETLHYNMTNLALLYSRGDKHWRVTDVYRRKRISVLRSITLNIQCSLLPGAS